MHAYVTSLKTCLANTCSSTRVQPRACYQGKYRRASSYYHVTRTTYFRAVLRAVLIEELFVLNFLIILFFSAHFFFLPDSPVHFDQTAKSSPLSGAVKLHKLRHNAPVSFTNRENLETNLSDKNDPCRSDFLFLFFFDFFS